MLATKFGPGNLLEYDGRYGVLICRECQYAIQKSAVQSHLLRHKIYRHERRRLLSSISQLDLFEPHHVPLPTPDSAPIDSLPVISGYCCTTVGCGNLCASSKRMRRHLSEVHGLNKAPSATFARPVKIQTFFRGTKLRYFEVDTSAAEDVIEAGLLAFTTVDHDGGDAECVEQGQSDNGQAHGEDAATQPPVGLLGSSQVNLDLETLTYFHHFTTITSLTLPGARHYWQTDVVLLALRQKWLMHGLLAISACHLAATTGDPTIKQAHREQSAAFLGEFSVGWDQVTQQSLDAMVSGEPAGEADQRKNAGERIRCILRGAFCALGGSTLQQGTIIDPAEPLHLQSIIATIQGIYVPDAGPYPGEVSAENGGHQGATPESTEMRARLLDLPYRMAEMFGKPDSAQDVLVMLSAISILVKCCDVSFASEEVEATWHGISIWAAKVPDGFNYLVSRHNPASLVVLAHWAASLVQRAENCGCWFIKGSAQTMLLQIAEQLGTDNSAAQNLVADLMLPTVNSAV